MLDSSSIASISFSNNRIATISTNGRVVVLDMQSNFVLLKDNTISLGLQIAQNETTIVASSLPSELRYYQMQC